MRSDGAGLAGERGVSGCPFCEVAERGLPRHGLFETPRAMVVLDREGRAFGHSMVIVRRHVRQLHDLTDVEFRAVVEVARQLAPALQAATGRSSCGYVAFGSGLPHAHLHVIRHDRRDVLLNGSKCQRHLGDDELAREARELRRALGFRGAGGWSLWRRLLSQRRGKRW